MHCLFFQYYLHSLSMSTLQDGPDEIRGWDKRRIHRVAELYRNLWERTQRDFASQRWLAVWLLDTAVTVAQKSFQMDLPKWVNEAPFVCSFDDDVFCGRFLCVYFSTTVCLTAGEGDLLETERMEALERKARWGVRKRENWKGRKNKNKKGGKCGVGRRKAPS